MVQGQGHALPTHRMTQADAAAMALARCCANDHERRLLPRVYQRTTVRARGSVLLHATSDALGSVGTRSPPYPSPSTVNPMNGYFPEPGNAAATHTAPGTGKRMQTYQEQAPPLAAKAVASALACADVDPGQVRHLVTVSCTGFHAPGVDLALIDDLKLPRDVSRTHVGFMGCHGAINGLRLVHSLARAHPNQAVVLCCVEVCSLHFQYGFDPQRMVANALFADGAAALVISGSERTDEHPIIADTHSTVIPDSRDAMSWTITDHGFVMSLSPRVPELIRFELRAWLEPWLKSQGLSISSVGSWAVHPGGPRVLDAVEDALDLPEDALAESRAVLREHGNMSSPTVLLILERLLKQPHQRPCVMLAFGPGLTAEAALIR